MHPWNIIQGTIPILLIASHNHNHIRGGNLKIADVGTGDVVEDLCETTGSWGIISSEVQTDPNWYHSSPFRNKIKKIISENKIQAVLDIHGRRESAEHLIEFLPNKTWNEHFADILHDAFVSNLLDNEQLTIVEDLDDLSVTAVEVEIRKDGRLKSEQNTSYESVQEKLVKIIEKLVG